MFIKKFEDFINEAYLKGGRQPVYHFTSTYGLQGILESDILKTSKPSRQSHGYDKSISLTRSIYYGDSLNDFCLELDSDRLLRDGYKIYPVDEWAWKGGKPNKVAIKDFNFIKSNFPEVKSGKRGTKHGLDLPKNPILETEFEERIYKNVENIGKYIIKIYISDSKMKYLVSPDLTSYHVIFAKYLEKYPHIEIYDSISRSSNNITNIFKNKEKLLNP